MSLQLFVLEIQQNIKNRSIIYRRISNIVKIISSKVQKKMYVPFKFTFFFDTGKNICM